MATEWGSIIATGLTTAIVGAFTAYASGQAGKTEAKINGNKHELRLPKLYAWLGWLLTTSGFASLSIPVILAENKTATWWVASASFLMCCGLGAPLLFYFYFHRLLYDDEGYTIYNWRGKAFSFSWCDAREIHFSPTSGYLKLRSIYQWNNLSSHLTGLRAFLNELEARTELKTDKLNLPF